MPTLIIVPTSHIAEESVKAVKEAIDRENPGCVAVELDTMRYAALKQKSHSNSASFRRLGFSTFLLVYILSRIQQSLGKRTGIFPGSEMTEAADYAREKGIDVAFIDMNIAETFAGFRRIGTKEKLRLLLYAVFGSLFSGRVKGIDLTKVPSQKFIKEAIAEIKREFPGIHRVLIEERDRHMASQLKKLSARYERIVAVVGAGHVKGIKQELKRTV